VSHDFSRMMTNTTGSISRLYCETCEEERLHKGGVCSCGARIETPKGNMPRTYIGLRSNRMDALTVKRRK
jgi:hypothetical protein